MTTPHVYEVLESIQPHGMGWEPPPDRSHGLYGTREAAEAKVADLARDVSWTDAASARTFRSPGTLATRIQEREVLAEGGAPMPGDGPAPA